MKAFLVASQMIRIIQMMNEEFTSLEEINEKLKHWFDHCLGVNNCKPEIKLSHALVDEFDLPSSYKYLKTYRNPITVEQIKTEFGGGAFQVIILTEQRGKKLIIGRKFLKLLEPKISQNSETKKKDRLHNV